MIHSYLTIHFGRNLNMLANGFLKGKIIFTFKMAYA